MPRRKKCRTIQGPPCCHGFKPIGVPAKFLEQIILSLDEYESIRLADYENLEHKDAAEKLGVSRSIFTRLLQEARFKVSQALIEGTEIIIEGGEYHFEKKVFRCLKCFSLFNVDVEKADPNNCPVCSSIEIRNLNENFGLKGQCHRHGRNYIQSR